MVPGGISHLPWPYMGHHRAWHAVIPGVWAHASQLCRTMFHRTPWHLLFTSALIVEGLDCKGCLQSVENAATASRVIQKIRSHQADQMCNLQGSFANTQEDLLGITRSGWTRLS